VSHYIKVEAVNIYNTVGDTQQLSVIRGASMLLRDVIDEISGLPELTSVSTGASVGYFELADVSKIDATKQRIHNILKKSPYCYGTYVVNDIQGTDDFRHDREVLIAQGRWQQYQQPSLSLPKLNNQQDTYTCAFEGVRAAHPNETIKVRRDDGIHPLELSPSVKARIEYGRTQKQQFFARELGRASDDGQQLLSDFRAYVDEIQPTRKRAFVDNLQDLAEDPERPMLNGKIAVIYADGNSFSKILRGFLENHPADHQTIYESWDKTLQDYRRAFLRSLLDIQRGHRSIQSQAWLTSGGRTRLETLLWGGDEFTLVVPAWLGWEVISVFFEESSGWSFTYPATNTQNATPLTHAVGMVYCSASAPINEMTGIAKTLAEDIKKEFKTGVHNAFAYTVLESFDQIVEHSRRHITPPSSEAPYTLFELPSAVKKLKDVLPKRQLYNHVQAVLELEQKPQDSQQPDAQQTLRNDIVAWLAGYAEVVPREMQVLETVFPDLFDRVIHLLELWDYLIVEDQLA
jgi:hypothetical protein